MAEDEEVRSRSVARSSRTVTAVKTAGHGASGGHSLTTILSRWRRQPGEEKKHMRPQDYQEYPKWVYPEGKPALIVNSADEEATALAGDPIVREDEERARLYKLADVKGVKIDKRWSVDRIAQTIADAGFDASLDPSK